MVKSREVQIDEIDRLIREYIDTDDDFKNKPWRRFLTNVKTMTEQMRALVEDLLDVAAIETGRLDLKTEPMAISRLL